jgi:anti-anti-sigma factor
VAHKQYAYRNWSADMVAESTAAAHWVLLLSGNLDLLAGPPLQARLDGLMSTGGVGLVLDLHDVIFMDAYGLRSLVWAATRFGDRLTLQRPPGRVRRVFEASGLIDVLPILSDDEAWPGESQADGGVRLRLDLCADTYRSWA